MQWYYTCTGEQQGPVEEQELFQLAATGKLAPSDYVWNEGMGENWQPAAAVEGLFAAPPPLPSPEAVPPGSVAISCTTPVGDAWQWMLGLLFRPFNFGKWFVLGFVAMLAGLGQSIGHGNLPVNWNTSRWSGVERPKLSDFAWQDLVENTRQQLHGHGDVVLVAVCVGVPVIVLFWLLAIWLRSRMAFVLLDNLVNDHADIKTPWQTFAQHGQSLFKWSVGYALVCSLASLAIIGIVAVTAVMPLLRGEGMGPSGAGGLLLAGVLWLLFGLVTAYINRFREDFIIPLMYKLDLTATEAWREFGSGIWAGRRGALLLYGLFWLLLALGAQCCIGLLGLLTCGIGCCCLMIPYIGTVVVLPVPVFFRFYSLEYLRQFGPKYALDAGGTAEESPAEEPFQWPLRGDQP